ncbi:MAG: trypsin-like peptidase domain-containing protein [Rubrobacter sp.]|nr:trypsin-like peptidase domain-containing protein [Propionibacteriaceae bacterium]MBA4116605.1 trypsin-like peptidase domain-containing protein [Rubrobacter sp.]
MTEGVPRPDRYRADRDILPIFVVTSPEAGQKLVSFQGTGFLIGKQVFVTCWHCVDTPLPDDRFYAVLVKAGKGFNYRAAALIEPEQDRNGADLATARVNLAPELGLTLAERDAPDLVDVWSFGYPFTALTETIPEVGRLPLIEARALKGYIMRNFYYHPPVGDLIHSYELDMPAPAGLSGGPVVRIHPIRGAREVIGVVHGSNDVATIAELASVDERGERRPEVQRISSFALAHHTNTLRNLTGSATGGRSLAEFLQT